MKCHRVEELIELMHPEWQKDSELNLMQFIIKLANEAGYKGAVEDLTDDILIYHLKMRNLPEDAMIPGLAKDCEDDFRAAILKARGIEPIK
ncbi:MAG: YihD family protein [Colwellia sp.]